MAQLITDVSKRIDIISRVGNATTVTISFWDDSAHTQETDLTGKTFQLILKNFRTRATVLTSTLTPSDNTITIKFEEDSTLIQNEVYYRYVLRVTESGDYADWLNGIWYFVDEDENAPSTSGLDVQVVTGGNTINVQVTPFGGGSGSGDLLAANNLSDVDDAAEALGNLGGASASALSAHTSDTGNPHEVTVTQLGLENVDNTSDADKPISNAQAAVNTNKADKPSSLTISSDTPELTFNTDKIAASAYTPTGNFAPTLAGSGHVLGVIHQFELVLDGVKTVTFPSLVYSSGFTDGAAPAVGTYTFMIMYWGGGLWVIASSAKITDPVAPSNLQLSVNNIDENNSINDVIGVLSADGGGSMTFSLVAGTGDTDNSSFNISGANLRAGEVFDYETKSSYSVRVEADNGVNPPVEAQFTITINDLSESGVTFTDMTVKDNTNITEGSDGNGITGTKAAGVDFGAWVTFEQYLAQDQDGYIKVQYPDNTPRGMIMGANSTEENAGKLNYEYAAMIATSSNAVQPRFNDNLVSPADNPTNIATDQWLVFGRESGVWKVWVADDEDDDPASWTLVHDFPITDQSPHYLGITLYQDGDNFYYPKGAGLTEPSDETPPTIDDDTLEASNAYVDVDFSEGVYGANDGSTPVAANDLAITNKSLSGASDVAIDSITKTGGGALTGGETTIRVVLDITGTPDGSDTFEIQPAGANTIFDAAGNAMADTQTTGTITLNDASSGLSFTDMTVLDDVNIDVTTPAEGTLLDKTGGGNWGAYCRFDQVVPENTDVYMKMQYAATDARGTMFGVNATDQLADYTNDEFTCYFNTSSDAIEARLNGGAVTENNPQNASVTDWVVLGRESGVWKVWRAADGENDPANWTLIHTFSGTHNGVYYTTCSIYLDGRNCYYPKSVGMTTR